MCDPNNGSLWVVPIASAFIAAASVCLSLAAWWTTREKLRLDLFDRRFAVFKAAVELWKVHCHDWTDSESERQVRDAFFRAQDEADFLFRDGSGVNEVLKRMQLASQRIVRHEMRSKDQYSEDQNKVYSDDKGWITGYSIAELRTRIAPYLDFHYLTTWSFIWHRKPR